MDKTYKDYTPRMGYMPCYKFPEELGEDEEFEFFKFRVPRQYIREHIAEGGKWPHSVDLTIKGSRDEAVVLGVGFFPVYSGVEYLEEDDDFLYYKVRVPKLFLDAPILNSEMTYRMLYEAKTSILETAEQKAERESEDTEAKKVPKAGEPMPGREELVAVKKVKEAKPILYEVTFECENCHETLGPEIGSDLFDILYSRCCEVCAGTSLKLTSCKMIVVEEEDG